jgi:hypothetical protein
MIIIDTVDIRPARCAYLVKDYGSTRLPVAVRNMTPQIDGWVRLDPL